MITPEQRASKEVRIAASSLGCRLFRNNSGGFYDADGRFVRFGLGNESKELNDKIKFGDYVGITPILITPEMVGKTIGVFTNIEVKPDGDLPKTLKRATSVKNSREAAQLAAIELVRSLGGLAWFAGCENDVQIIHALYLQELKK